MAALGDRPAREVTTREIEDLLRSISSTGVAPRTVNKARQLVCAIFNYGTRPSTYGLPANPAQHADRRREPDAAPLAFYSPEQVEALAPRPRRRRTSRPVPAGAQLRRDRRSRSRGRTGRRSDPRRGLRRPPPRRAGRAPLARRRLRWPQAHRPPRAVRRHRGSLDEEPPGTPGAASRSGRRGARAPAAAAATSRDRTTTCSPAGSADGLTLSAPAPLRARTRRRRLEPLRFHDLRHTYGSLLVAGGIDLPSVKAAMGHSHITTTERYLHARRPASSPIASPAPSPHRRGARAEPCRVISGSGSRRSRTTAGSANEAASTR